MTLKGILQINIFALFSLQNSWNVFTNEIVTNILNLTFHMPWPKESMNIPGEKFYYLPCWSFCKLLKKRLCLPPKQKMVEWKKAGINPRLTGMVYWINRTQLNVIKWQIKSWGNIWLPFDCVRQSNWNYLIVFNCAQIDVLKTPVYCIINPSCIFLLIGGKHLGGGARGPLKISGLTSATTLKFCPVVDMERNEDDFIFYRPECKFG